MKARMERRRLARMSGVVLPTILVFLLILSIAAVVLVEQISSQTRMAANSANMSAALQAAEATLQSASSQIVAGAYVEAQFRGNANGLYFFNALNYSATNPVPWQTAAGWATAIHDPVALVGDKTKQRRFIIEELPAVISPGGSSQKAFRITARVIGADNQTVVMLQSFYKL